MTVLTSIFSSSLPISTHIGELFRDDTSSIFRPAAEAQIEEEKEGENLFWKVLDYLGRPQAAVAGVLHDYVDGGGFDPLSRISKAVMGEERYGIKEVIDEISPGDWSRVQLPDWLGGKEVDWLKGGVGFFGDIMTDPLMHLRLFRLAGGVRKILGPELALSQTMFNKSASRLQPLLDEKVAAKASKLKLASHLEKGLLIERERTAFLRWMFRKGVEEPNWEFARGFDDVLDPYRKMKGKWASPTLAEQFSKGERSILGANILLLGKHLGIKDMKLLPQIDRRLGESISRGIGEFWIGARLKHPKINEMVKSFQNVFLHSSGDPLVDYIKTVVAGRHAANTGLMRDLTRKVQDAFGKNLNHEDIREVLKYLEHPREYFGISTREIPEQYRKSVVALQDVFKGMHTIEKATGIRKGFIGGPAGYLQAHKNMRVLVDNQAKRMGVSKAYYVPTHMSSIEIVKAAEREIDAAAKAGGWQYSTVQRKILKRQTVEKIVKTDLDGAALWLDSTIPKAPMGYFPRYMTDDAKKILGDIISHPKIQYHGVQASYWLKNALARGKAFKDMDVLEINELFKNGDIPHDFFESIWKQARGQLKGTEVPKLMKQFLGTLDETSLPFFMEDPIQAMNMRIVQGLRAVTNKDRMDQMLLFGARKLSPTEITGKLGENVYFLTPIGMETMLGKEWKRVLGDNGLASYKALIDNARMKVRAKLTDSVIRGDMKDIMDATRHGVPLYAMNAEMAGHMNKVIEFSQSPEWMKKMLSFFDEGTNLWKATTLFPFPGYYARNLLGMFHQSWLGDTMTISNWRAGLETMMATKGWEQGLPEFARKTKFFKGRLGQTSKSLDDMISGTSYTMRQVDEQMRKYNVLQGFFPGELYEKAGYFDKPGKAREAARFFTQHGPLLKTGAYVSTWSDNWGRYSHFIGELRNGKHPYEAAMSVKKYFFNYQELTQFEKVWLRRAFPFYSWLRFNLPLQLEAMATQPGKYGHIGRMIEFVQSEEAQKFDRKKLPKWVTEQFGIPTQINKQTGNLEVMLLRSWIPSADLMSVVHTNPMYAMARTGTTMLHPLPKTMAEFYRGKSFFTEKPISEFSGDVQRFFGKPMNRKLVHALKTVRAAGEANKLFWQTQDAGTLMDATRFLNAAAIFPKIKGFDIGRLERQYEFDIRKRTGTLKKRLKQAQKSGDEETEAYLMELFKEMKTGG